MNGRQIITRTLTVFSVVIVLGYSYFVLDDFIRGPRIIVETPKNTLATTSPRILVSGHAIHINSLSLNGGSIPFDLEGNFSESLLLAPGYNIMKLTATDRYERIVEKTLEINLLATPLATSTVSTTTVATTTPLIKI